MRRIWKSTKSRLWPAILITALSTSCNTMTPASPPHGFDLDNQSRYQEDEHDLSRNQEGEVEFWRTFGYSTVFVDRDEGVIENSPNEDADRDIDELSPPDADTVIIPPVTAPIRQ